MRAGAASDPDQAFVDIHGDLGDLLPDLRLQPSLDLGFSDAVGGLKIGLTAGNDLLVEVQLGGGEAFGATILVGLTF